MINTITIRRGTEADADTIAVISRRTFYDSFAGDNTPENMEKFMTVQFSHEMLKQQVYMPGNIFLLAYMNNEPAGYVRMQEENAPPALQGLTTMEIARIYSMKHAIGKGVGSALMRSCIDIARSQNKEVLWLGVWEKNQRAIDFYTRWGFEKFGEHIFMVGDDPQTDWFMKKMI